MIIHSIVRVIRIDPLPGDTPYENRRTMRVKQSHDSMKLIDFLHHLHPPVPTDQWRLWIERGEITLSDSGAHSGIGDRVQAGQCFVHRMPGTTEPKVASQIGILYEDESILVVDKPAPLPVHPSGRFNRNTLVEFLRPSFPDQTLRISHRLDANTSGIVMFCKTQKAAGRVQSQFERRSVIKEYTAEVSGIIPWDDHQCELPIRRAAETPGRTDTRGARVADPDGQSAITRFRVIQRHVDGARDISPTKHGTTTVRAIPVTGRTNQIRVHLWALGFPIIGDPLYLPDRSLGHQQTLGVDDPLMRLRANRLTIIHPETQRPITFELNSVPSMSRMR